MAQKFSAKFPHPAPAMIFAAVAVSAVGCTVAPQDGAPAARHGPMGGQEMMDRQHMMGDHVRSGMSSEPMATTGHHAAQGMSAQQSQLMQSMMEQMRTCMNSMGVMDEANRAQMHSQMMDHMQTCAQQIDADEK